MVQPEFVVLCEAFAVGLLMAIQTSRCAPSGQAYSLADGRLSPPSIPNIGCTSLVAWPGRSESLPITPGRLELDVRLPREIHTSYDWLRLFAKYRN
jgi:hypothetical protein